MQLSLQRHHLYKLTIVGDAYFGPNIEYKEARKKFVEMTSLVLRTIYYHLMPLILYVTRNLSNECMNYLNRSPVAFRKPVIRVFRRICPHQNQSILIRTLCDFINFLLSKLTK